jgi:hypothetical protein
LHVGVQEEVIIGEFGVQNTDLSQDLTLGKHGKVKERVEWKKGVKS